ncbi:MAG: RluA family pseudouridine synthase [Bacteroidales bacterium]|nr:RluA family pseudouridine synthase [Bacteroidales bacterium]
MFTTPNSKNPSFKVLTPITLIEFLKEQLKGQSNSSIKEVLTNHRVLLNNHDIITQYNYQLKQGDVINILSKKNHVIEFKHPKLKILYEDEYLFVVSKKEGLLSIATEKEKVHTAYHILNDYVKQYDERNRVYIVHRLDKDTSGVMMFAKKPEIQEQMQDNWKQYVLERTYAAVIEGVPDKMKDTIYSTLTEDKFQHMRSLQGKAEGKRAVTTFEVVQKNNKYSLLKLVLDTGRKNQIRIHLQSIGHPIVGDKKYGSKIDPIHRMCLHAKNLTFIHPVTKETMRFEIPLPRKFLELVSDIK